MVIEKISSKLQEFNKIAIIGMGVSGRSSERLLKALDKDIFIVADTNDTSEDDINELSHCDLVILSPGIARDNELLSSFKGPIWSEIELGYQFIRGENIVAITGTNGKTTTVSFLEECLKYEQRPYFVGGNIGTPLCDYIYEKYFEGREVAKVVVLELSSFQLESVFSFHADIACVLNITFSHGERYSNLTDYAIAKKNIFINQNQHAVAIYPKGLWQDLGLDNPVGARQIEINLDTNMSDELSKIIDLNSLQIFGHHNHANLVFAYHICSELGVRFRSFVQACENFRGVHYRFEYLGERDGLKIFNDAKSTNWQATETALSAVDRDDDIHLVLGGQLRGEGDFQAEVLMPFKDRLKNIFLIGEAGKLLEQHLSDFSTEYIESISNLPNIIKEKNLTGSLVFSPAFPSFDQFKNYVDRGECFSKLFS